MTVFLEYQYQEIPRDLVGEKIWEEYFQSGAISESQKIYDDDFFEVTETLQWEHLFENVISLNSNLIHSANVIALTLGWMNILS